MLKPVMNKEMPLRLCQAIGRVKVGEGIMRPEGDPIKTSGFLPTHFVCRDQLELTFSLILQSSI